MRPIALLMLLPLAACASTPPPHSGFLAGYQGLQPKSALRAGIYQRRDVTGLEQVRKVAILPPTFALGVETDWMGEAGKTAILREVEAQLCFELSERYEVAPAPAADAATVRTAVTRVRPTGRTGSAAAAAVGILIPGPVGVRAPGALGGLAMESEMLVAGKQVAAIVWSRKASALGTDNPSLSRIGDALQFAEPFADAAAKAMRAKGAERRRIDPKADPCAAYGPRFRPAGWAARFATGLYVPELSGAKPEDAAAGK